MKSVYVLILGFLVFTSCEKNGDPSLVETDPPDYFPLIDGSFWVYDTYLIDSTGNEVIESSNDTIRIIGDTLIAGTAYKVVRGKQFPLASSPMTDRFYRDSSGYIMDQENSFVFASDNYGDTIFSPQSWGENSGYLWFKTLEPGTENINVSSTSYESVVHWKLTVVRTEAEDEIIGSLDSYFAPGIGRILYQFTFVGLYDYNRNYYEVRLVDHFIAP